MSGRPRHVLPGRVAGSVDSAGRGRSRREGALTQVHQSGVVIGGIRGHAGHDARALHIANRIKKKAGGARALGCRARDIGTTAMRKAAQEAAQEGC